MKKNLIIICNLACLIGFFTGLLGCDQQTNEPITPKIVRKKIRSNTAQKSGPPQRKTAHVSRPAVKTGSSGSGKQASEKPVLAQKSGSAVAAKPEKTKAPKLPLKPKSDISKIQTPVQRQPAESGGSLTTVASTSSKNRPTYNPKGKVNPFEPLFRERQVVASKSKRKRRVPRTPLEKIDLGQLKLVGIVMASSGNKALVEESNGKGYVIKKGTYIGTNAGKVVQIESEKVIVAEEFEDYRGNVTIRNKEIKLPKPPGEF